jgi:hypothetical protein
VEQVVLRRSEENGDTIIPERVSGIIDNVDQPAEQRSQEENNLPTSILKKEESEGPKKTVHFPENIVSVKFYEISDEEDSDNDTLILSDPEEDDLRDQEVPAFNTSDDYDSNFCHLSSTNFIPQFTFPPVLKIANCHLYENIDDHDEQIMAIMDDDDGRDALYANHLATDKISDDMGSFQDEALTEEEVASQSRNDEDFHEESEIASAEVKKPSKNPEEALEITEIQETLIKNRIEENEVGPLQEALEIKTNNYLNETSEGESSMVKENALVLATFNQDIERPAENPANFSCVNNKTNIIAPKVNELDFKVYTLLDALKAAPNNSVAVAKKECLNEENFGQQVTIPKRALGGEMTSNILLPERHIYGFPAQRLEKMQTELTKSDMVKKWLITTHAPMTDASFSRTGNVDMLATNTTRLSEENMVTKREPTTELANVLHNDVQAESKGNLESCMGASARTFHGSCGSKFLRRGSRSIDDMILDEVWYDIF